MKPSLTVKGIQNGLLITLPAGEWLNVTDQLMETVAAQDDFFRGARLAIQVEDRALGAAELGSLRSALAEHEVTLWAIISTSETTQSAAADLGLSRDLEIRRAEDDDIPADTQLPGEEAVLLQRTLRSGHSVRHPGHVVVIGDVNPGAEIIAGGHIVVWGRLRGVVHAGAAGDESSMVCALDLAPTQLRIAGHITVSPSRRGKPKPERAFIRDDQLIAEPWQAGHK
ncbi:MAG: septum site-determining protein MinC [Anaerolineales bacterium]|nr:MAG: septum site-determining protein MinC [Anaerolineales bacterium]